MAVKWLNKETKLIPVIWKLFLNQRLNGLYEKIKPVDFQGLLTLMTIKYLSKHLAEIEIILYVCVNIHIIHYSLSAFIS